MSRLLIILGLGFVLGGCATHQLAPMPKGTPFPINPSMQKENTTIMKSPQEVNK